MAKCASFSMNKNNISSYLDIVNVSHSDVFDIPDSGDIAVILCHFNPCLYEAPVENIKMVLKWLFKENIPTYAVELRCGLNINSVPVLPSDHPKVIQLQSKSAIFRKDNLWNIAVSNVPKTFRYILCIDADTILVGKDWKQKLLQELNNYKIVQPFSKAIWTDSIGQAFKEKMSCGYAYSNKLDNPQISKYFHSGFAIALHRNFWGETSGMFNSPVGGGSLFLMSAIMGLPNELEPSLSKISSEFLNAYLHWAKSIYKWTDTKFSFLDCEAWHLWHGSRQKRKYFDRFERLNGFNPDTDIVEVASGLHEWSLSASFEKAKMIETVEEYLNTREEDEWFISS